MFSSSSCIFVSCGISIQENHYVTKTFMWWICMSVELLKTDESLYLDQFLSNPVMHMCDTSLKWDTNVSIHSLCVHRLLKRVKLHLPAGNFDLITIWHGMMIETFSCMMLWKLTKKKKKKKSFLLIRNKLLEFLSIASIWFQLKIELKWWLDNRQSSSGGGGRIIEMIRHCRWYCSRWQYHFMALGLWMALGLR